MKNRTDIFLNSRNKRILHLNCRKVSWDAILNGTKLKLFRRYNDFWKKRIENKEYDLIYVKMGYPKSDDYSRIMIFKWEGYDIEMSEYGKPGHMEFIKTFGIKLDQRLF